MSNKGRTVTGKNSVAYNKKESAKTWLIALFFALAITTAAFMPMLNNEFVNWDDDRYITDNMLLQDISATTLAGIFNPTTGIVNYGYTPLVMATFAIEKQLWGLNPLPYHITNLLLHLLCVSLVIVLMRLLKLRVEAVMLVGVLFGIHTMRVESVAWISERKDLMFTLFSLASMNLYLLSEMHPQKQKRYLLAALLLFVFALLSKIQAVALPLTLLCLDYYRGKIGSIADFRKRALQKTPFFILSLAAGLMGVYFIGKEGGGDIATNFAIHNRLLIGTYTLLVYLGKFILPLPATLSVCYPYPAQLSLWHYASPLLLVPLVYSVYRSAKYNKAILTGFLIFFVNIVFVLQVVGVGQAYLADRFTYLPYIGLLFIVGYGYQYLLHNTKTYLAVTTAGALIYIGVLFAFTRQQTQVWQNSETLWTDALAKYPYLDVAFSNRGKYYNETGQSQKALADFEEVLRINPNYLEAYINRGALYSNLGETDKALADYEKIIAALDPQGKWTNREAKMLSVAYNNRGAGRFKNNQTDEACKDYNKALEVLPTYTDAYANRAICHAMNKEHEKAISDFSVYLAVNKENAQAFYWRAISYNQLGQFNNALQDLNIALQLQPQNGEYYHHRSLAYEGLGNSTQAQTDAQKAQQLGYIKPQE